MTSDQLRCHIEVVIAELTKVHEKHTQEDRPLTAEVIARAIGALELAVDAIPPF